ncbi:PREDICTED: vegetative cell wall protein gp1-like [Elephantulus edwardii]|uniref:vegetative cell wall protein gp1-like n=1 Tax=Elephantulus edwardii TaxID=28737 RepID=UPI0003F0D22D|nr:PREDICTED: vegetative cell wall protein gp1-like [Elephantulus edwardii]
MTPASLAPLLPPQLHPSNLSPSPVSPAPLQPPSLPSPTQPSTLSPSPASSAPLLPPQLQPSSEPQFQSFFPTPRSSPPRSLCMGFDPTAVFGLETGTCKGGPGHKPGEASALRGTQVESPPFASHVLLMGTFTTDKTAAILNLSLRYQLFFLILSFPQPFALFPHAQTPYYPSNAATKLI